MKKSVFLLSSLVMSCSAFAQWSKPVPTFTEMVDDNTTIQYLYNVEYGGFLVGANDWDTRGSLSKDKGFQMKIEKIVDNNVTKWGLRDYAEKHSAWNEFDCSNYDYIWCDGEGRTGAKEWVITSLGNNKYEITNLAVPNGKFGWAPYLKDETNSRVWILDYSQMDDNEEKLFMEEASCTTWTFVSETEYSHWFDLNSTYNSAVILAEYLEETKAKYPEIELSDAKAVYDNLTSTKAELDKALIDAKAYVKDYLAENVTVDKPKDMTENIVNPSFDVIEDFTGWMGDPFGAGGIKSTCAEQYSVNFNSYQDLEEMPNGIYKVSARGFYRAGSIENDWNTKDDISFRHAKLYAKSGNDSIAASLPSISSWATNVEGLYGEQITEGLYVPNTMEQFTAFKEAGIGELTSVFVPVNNNSIRLGVSKSTLIVNDWSIVDDFTLTYYGNSLEAYKLWAKDAIEAANKTFNSYYYEDIYCNKKAVEQFAMDIQAIEEANTAEGVTEAIKKANKTLDEFIVSVNAYKDYYDKVVEIRNYINSTNIVGTDAEKLMYYVADRNEDNDWEFAHGTAYIILTEGKLTTAEIAAEITFLEELKQTAVKNSLQKGDDCSEMLINPSFKDGFEGWQKAEGIIGNKTIFPNVECYETVVDIKQTVRDVPAGLYAITVNAFERPGANGNYSGTENPKVFLFMNDYKTPVMNICNDILPEERAVNLENCYITKTSGEWPYDFMVTDANGNTGWVPNSVDGVAYAFRSGRYEQTCYGLVGEDGVMTIGLTSNGVKLGSGGWVNWANFKLTYMDKDANALTTVLKSLCDTISSLKDSNIEILNQKAAMDIESVINEANMAINKGDEAILWDVVQNMHSYIDKAHEYISVLRDLSTAKKNWESAVKTYQKEATATALSEQKAIDDIITTNEVDNYGLEEILAFTERIINNTAAIKIPNSEGASDANPIDMTRVIINSSFEEGNLNGWTNSGSISFQTQTNTAFQKVGEVYAEKWHETGTLDIHQTIRNLPNGNYILTANCFTQTDDAILYINEAEVAIPASKDAMETKTYSVSVFVSDGTITIGNRCTLSANTWNCVDEFKLAFTGNEEPTSINDATASVSTIKAIFTTAGVRVKELSKGVNIIKMTDGSVNKILIR